MTGWKLTAAGRHEAHVAGNRSQPNGYVGAHVTTWVPVVSVLASRVLCAVTRWHLLTSTLYSCV